MSKLYVANCTSQTQEVHYRLDFSTDGVRVPFTPATQQKIESGQQILIAGRDLHLSQVESIVRQLSRHGMIAAMEVARAKGRVRQVFNVDKPVAVALIRDVMDMNAGYLTEEGRVRRRNAAIAANGIIANSVTNDFTAHGIPKEPTQKVDVEFEQLEQSEAGERRIEEGYQVRDDMPAMPPPKSRRMKRAA